MTERFNFYDIYGFVLPGFAAISVFCTCVFFTTGWFPEIEIGETVVALVLAYLLGVGIQEVARDAIPSNRVRQGTARRYPSDALLDGLQLNIKECYQAALKARFGLDIQAADQSLRAEARNEGFKLARTFLVQEGVARYGEQFQGLQVMFRGLAAVLWIGGWLCVGAASSAGIGWTLLIVAIALGRLWWCRAVNDGTLWDTAVRTWIGLPVSGRWAVLGAITLGLVIGLAPGQAARPMMLLCMAGASLLLVPPLLVGHDRMADAFAGEVIRAFAVSASKAPTKPEP